MKVLFVCTGNTCRSVIAEYLFRKMLKEAGRRDVETSSAGTSAGGGVEVWRGIRDLLAQEGCDVSAHRSRPVTEKDVEEADWILTMEWYHKERLQEEYPAHKKKIHLLTKFAGVDCQDIRDPIGDEKELKTCLARIRQCLERLMEKLDHVPENR